MFPRPQFTILDRRTIRTTLTIKPRFKLLTTIEMTHSGAALVVILGLMELSGKLLAFLRATLAGLVVGDGTREPNRRSPLLSFQ